MLTPDERPNDNENTKTEASTEESIRKGQDMIKAQQKENPASEETKQEEAAKDAEQWRNEG